MSTQYEINKELVLSTAHISFAEAQKLAKGVDGLVIAEDEYSYRVSVASHINGLDEIKTDIPVIKSLILLSEEYGCKWLVLDQDGPVMDNLERWEW